MNRKTVLRAVAAVVILSVFFIVGLRARIPDPNPPVSHRPDTAVEDAVPAADFEPAYLSLHRSGEFARRGEKLWQIMESCELCPRACGVNRLAGERGFCRAPGTELVVATAQPHFGEERPLVGKGGSGTIFLSHCNLRCVFCQNYQISIQGRGQTHSIDELAQIMLHLQSIGCHNINVVTPTHYSPHIVKALDIAAERGLRLPVVWNTSGWERVEILRLLDGVVDIYLPDIKYYEAEEAATYSAGASSYPKLTRKAVLEMHRQVGTARPAEDGLVYRGLMIRHLVMPDSASGSQQVVEWIAANLPEDTYVNIMAQYTPFYKAFEFPRISRRVTLEEYLRVVERARELGLSQLDLSSVRWLR